MKLKLLIFSLSLITLKTSAQISKLQLGVAAIGTYFGNDPELFSPGIDVFAGILTDKEFGLTAGFTYYQPIKKTNSDGFSNYNEDFKCGIINLEAEFNFGKSQNYNLGIYIPIGISYLIGDYTYQSSSANRNIYLKEDLDGLAVNLGLGYYYKLGNVTLFSDLKAGVPIVYHERNQYVNQLNETSNTPFQTTLKFGIKIPKDFSSNPYAPKKFK